MENILSIENLHVNYLTNNGNLKALRNINFDIPKNSVVGVIGESGCGKSTLISSIVSLIPENANIVSGNIKLQNKSILNLNRNKMKKILGNKISVIFQDPMTSLNPVMSIGKQMLLSQHHVDISKNEKIKRTLEMLDLVGIPDSKLRFNDLPHQFSGGMRQRIMIAMAIQSNPDLLIADEPTTALDVTTEIQIINLLKNLQNKIECSILFITHNLSLVADFCDYVLIMYAGVILEKGKMRNIFSNPQHPYTKKLFSCDPSQIEEKISEFPYIKGNLPDLTNLKDGCVFSSRCEKPTHGCREGIIHNKLIEYSKDHWVDHCCINCKN
tara:strand:- start:226 stop:1203 length:978 start_codon:yes stop_codon:yes gene_type:complete